MVREIIFPFLEKIGILWQTGHIMPAQEHFVTNIIRQKLIVAIDSVPCNPQGKSCILFLPEGEHHELGLLFLSYLVKSRGGKMIYLGANVPHVAMLKASYNDEAGTRLLYTLTSTSPNFNFEKFLRVIDQKSSQHSHYHIWLSHSHLTIKKFRPSFKFKKTFAEVMEFIETI